MTGSGDMLESIGGYYKHYTIHGPLYNCSYKAEEVGPKIMLQLGGILCPNLVTAIW